MGLGAVNVLIVPFIVDDLRVSEAWFGPLEAAQVAGMIAAGAAVAALARRLRAPLILSSGLAALGTAVAGLALVAEPWHMVLALLVVGLSVAPVQASVSTIIQHEVDDDMRGRIGSLFNTVVTAASVTSMAVAGGAAALIGVRGVFVAAGAVAILAAIVAAALLRASVTEPVKVNAGE